MDKPITLRLTLTVTYQPNGEVLSYLKDRLSYIAEHASGAGLMTGDSDAEVEKWTHKVEVVPAKTRTFHVLARNGQFYAGHTAGNQRWINTQDTARLFDMTNKAEAYEAESLCAEGGGRLFPVEVDAE